MCVSRYLSSFCIIATSVVCALSSQPALAGNPVFRAAPGTFQFGQMPEGAKAYATYWLANDGSDTLNISRVKPQCGCTAAPLDDKVIAPGDSVALEISFNTAKIHGSVHKKISIHYNDTSASPGEIFFSAKVGPNYTDVTPEPSNLDFNNYDKVKEDIVLVNTGDNDYALGFAQPPPSYLSCHFDQEIIPAGGRAVLTVQVNDSVPLGMYESSLTLTLQGKESQSITLPVAGMGYVR